jgi:prepilin-type N-terminal cleavage/methylation domain-containing protein
MNHKHQAQSTAQSQGFSLVELLLALVIGCGLTGGLLQAMLAEGSNGQRLGRLLRERVVARRTLELVRGDLLQAQGQADPAVVQPACNLAGRTVVLHLATAAGPITYSLGKPAEPIWRGRVLMRCGPAYGLHGELGSGAAQNRVVLDALASSDGFRADAGADGVLELQVQQSWADGGQLRSVLPVALLRGA